ncbi:MAG: hypothetical protein HKL80_04875 [Acidimicrobiales bacterium]|nr:hypothetical protein [Acidimicrobiales bacterium]
MARGNINRVARAAASGGSRTYKESTPWGYYSVLIVIAVLGMVGIVFSRIGMQARAVAASTTTSVPASALPVVGTSWKEAIGFDICGTFQKNLPPSSNTSTVGITTDGNGIIDIAPKSASESGSKATLGYFVNHYTGLTLTSNTFQYPGQVEHKNGGVCPGLKGKANVEVWVFNSLLDKTGHKITTNPDGLKLVNAALITVAYVPSESKITQPPSATALQIANTTVPQTSSPSVSVPPGVSLTSGIGTAPVTTSPTTAKG